MTEKKSPPEKRAKAEAIEDGSETPMDRFRALAKRLARVSKKDLQREIDKRKKART